MSFSIKFNSQKEHDDYIRHQASKLGFTSDEVIINASDVIKTPVKKKYRPRAENKNKAWTQEEDTYIVQHYNEMKSIDLAKRLGRTKPAVQSRVTFLRDKGHNLPLKAHPMNPYEKKRKEEFELNF